LIVRKYAEPAALDAASHSLRWGFHTSAAEAGSPVLGMVEVSPHKSVDMLTSHVRRSYLFREHTGKTFF
jgi:hypothetical protein